MTREELAEAIAEAFEEQSQNGEYVFWPEDTTISKGITRITLDGHFDLLAVADKLLALEKTC